MLLFMQDAQFVTSQHHPQSSFNLYKQQQEEEMRIAEIFGLSFTFLVAASYAQRLEGQQECASVGGFDLCQNVYAATGGES
jgi:hypothetical protein